MKRHGAKNRRSVWIVKALYSLGKLVDKNAGVRSGLTARNTQHKKLVTKSQNIEPL